MKLNYKKTILVGFAFMSICLFWEIYDGEIQLILTKYIQDAKTIGFVMAWDNILALFMLPLFGYFSDKTHTKWGKRMPFIVIGTVLASFFFILTAVIDANSAVLGNLTLPLLFTSLLLTLVSLSVYRSPAVALMPDVTIKPLRSKANAVINLMGALGGAIALGLLMFGVSDLAKENLGTVIDPNWVVTGGNDLILFTVTALIMIVMVAILVIFVKEPKLVAEKQAEDIKYEIEEKEAAQVVDNKPLPRAVFISLILILASIFLWFMGYNAVTSTFSRYVLKEWGEGNYSILKMMGVIGGILAFIPVAAVASKIGRKKTILIGIVVLTSCLGAAYFVHEANIWAYVLLFLAGVSWAAINVNSYPMVVEMSKNSNIGKYTGYYYAFSMAAQIITPILSGAFIDLYGYWILFPYGAIFSGLAFITMFFVRHGDAKAPKLESKLSAFDVDD